jgi:hypothetical protein
VVAVALGTAVLLAGCVAPPAGAVEPGAVVDVAVAVPEAADVGELPGVLVGVLVGRGVFVGVLAVEPPLPEPTGVFVGVLVGVFAGVFVGVLVGVLVAGSACTERMPMFGTTEPSPVPATSPLSVPDNWNAVN